ncbi:MAG TPA: cytochrome c biogenesis protein CcdA [Chloroflexota bacterium]|nr:cytochrome c biogenesis protein CcdA [Chloroflexota bacterium]
MFRTAPGGWLTRSRDHAGALGALLALAAAIVAALLAGPDGGSLTLALAGFSGSSSELLRDLGAALPLGFAFGAGMVAAVNPCGFALLPAYFGLYLGTSETEAGDRRPLARALVVSGTMTASFVLFFGAAGLLLGAARVAVGQYFPWGSLAVGVLLILAGGRMLSGSPLYAGLPHRLAGSMGGLAGRSGIVGYFGYGLAFALTSLSCTLPIFLAVVGSAFTVQGLAAGLFQFVLYGLGMGLVLTTLTLLAAWLKRVALGPTRRLGRYVESASALLLLITGAYVVFYWLTLGGLLRR